MSICPSLCASVPSLSSPLSSPIPSILVPFLSFSLLCLMSFLLDDLSSLLSQFPSLLLDPTTSYVLHSVLHSVSTYILSYGLLSYFPLSVFPTLFQCSLLYFLFFKYICSPPCLFPSLIPMLLLPCFISCTLSMFFSGVPHFLVLPPIPCLLVSFLLPVLNKNCTGKLKPQATSIFPLAKNGSGSIMLWTCIEHKDYKHTQQCNSVMCV